MNNTWIIKLPFEETLDNFEAETETHEKTVRIIKWLVQLILDYDSIPPKPIMLALHGESGRGKTHLLKAFLNELARNQINYHYEAKPNTALSYYSKDKKIIAYDDLFAERKNMKEFRNYDYQYLEELIFDIYEYKRIFIFTSNFSLNQLTEFIKKHDEIWRITSRIDEFIGICPDIQIDWEDYRKKIWEKTKDIFSSYFS